MRKIAILFLFVSVLAPGFSQDMEMYHRYTDDRLVMPEIPVDMSFDEFQLLSRDVKLMDMAAAVAMPGYISFKAKENFAAYAAITARVIGYAGAALELYRYYDQGPVDFLANNFDRNMMYAAAGVLIASYCFDWLFGKTKLEEKQEAIRYKYRKELKSKGTF